MLGSFDVYFICWSSSETASALCSRSFSTPPSSRAAPLREFRFPIPEDEVDIDDFVQGCMRMKGSATSIDMQMLAYQAPRARPVAPPRSVSSV